MTQEERLEVISYADPVISAQLVYVWARNNIITFGEFFELTKKIHEVPNEVLQ